MRRAPAESLQEALAANNLDVQKALDWLVQKGRSAKGKVRAFLLFAFLTAGRLTASLLMAR